jgi:hypothetical protein
VVDPRCEFLFHLAELQLLNTSQSRDNQISTSHGRPRALRADDSNVRPLQLRDFDVTADNYDALIFIHFVRITSILGDITEHYRCGSLSELHRLNIETALLRWIDELPPALCLHDKTSRVLNPYEFKSRQLHGPYFVALTIFYRSESPGQHFSLMSLLAASFISGIFEEYIAWGDIMFLAPASIFYLLVASLIQISSHRYINLAQNAETEISTVRVSLKQLRKRFPTAYGAERIFENLLRKSRSREPPSQIFSMTLSPIQKELLAPFGFDLCPSWSLVFNNSFTGTETLDVSEQFSTVSRNHHPQNSTLRASTRSDFPVAGVDSTQDTYIGSDDAANGLQMLQPAEDLGDSSFGGLDLWWPDWTESNCT